MISIGLRSIYALSQCFVLKQEDKPFFIGREVVDGFFITETPDRRRVIYYDVVRGARIINSIIVC